MAEFCKECFIKNIAVPLDNTTDEMLIMSEEVEFCEGCGEIKPIVVTVNSKEFYKQKCSTQKVYFQKLSYILSM